MARLFRAVFERAAADSRRSERASGPDEEIDKLFQ